MRKSGSCLHAQTNNPPPQSEHPTRSARRRRSTRARDSFSRRQEMSFNAGDETNIGRANRLQRDLGARGRHPSKARPSIGPIGAGQALDGSGVSRPRGGTYGGIMEVPEERSRPRPPPRVPLLSLDALHAPDSDRLAAEGPETSRSAHHPATEASISEDSFAFEGIR